MFSQRLTQVSALPQSSFNARWLPVWLCLTGCMQFTPCQAQQFPEKPQYTRWPASLANPASKTLPPTCALAYSPDGQWLAVGTQEKSRPGRVTVWDTARGQPVWGRIQMLGMLDLVFSADGSLLATSNMAGQVVIYDRSGNERLRKTLSQPAKTIAFSPQGNQLAAGGQDGKLLLWEIPSGKSISTRARHPAEIVALAYAAHDRLYLAGGDSQVRCWNPATDQWSHTFTTQQSTVRDLVASADGNFLATANTDGTIRVWDAYGKLQRSLTTPESRTVALAIRSDGQRLLAGSTLATPTGTPQPCRLRLWSTTEKSAVRELHSFPPDDPLLAVAFSPDGRTAATATGQGQVSLWDLNSGQQTRSLNPQTHGPRPLTPLAMDYSADGSLLAVAHDDGQVRILDRSGTIQKREIHVLADAIACVDFAPKSNVLAVSGYHQDVKLVDAITGKVSATLTGHQAWVLTVSFSADGTRLATGSYDKTVRVWDISQRKQLYQLDAHTASVECVAMSPDGRLLASGCSDHVLRLWDTQRRTLVWSNSDHQGAIRCVAFSADGKLLASASDDKTIRLWGVAETNTQLRHRMVGHRDTVWSLDFSPRDALLLSGGADGLIGIWDLATGKSQMLQRRHTDTVSAVRFGDDGRFFLSGGYDKQLLYWPQRGPRP